MIYLNYAASTPFIRANLDTYLAVSEEYFSIPSMNHDAFELQSQAMKLILNTISYDNHRLTFTSGGSEANNIAIIGYAKRFKTSKHFITTYYEHSSVYETFRHLEGMGHRISYLFPNENGEITYEDVVSKIKDDTVFVSIMQVNNEIGIINDVNYIFGKLKQQYNHIVTMSDVTQAVGKIKLPNKAVTDIITFTAHKIYGPKGCGALVTSPNLELRNILYGGDGLRPGTQNLAAQVSFAKAIKLIYENMSEYESIVHDLRTYIYNKLAENDKLELNIRSKTNIFSIYVDSMMLGEVLINELHKRGIEVSTKSACSSKSKELSRSLMAIDLPDEKINKTLRISISHLTTYEEIDILFDNLKEIINEDNFDPLW